MAAFPADVAAVSQSSLNLIQSGYGLSGILEIEQDLQQLPAIRGQ
jgi:hypothetical protein